MDFKLTDEQELIVDSYREYMESENWETYFHECDEKHEYPPALGGGPVRAGLRPRSCCRVPRRPGP